MSAVTDCDPCGAHLLTRGSKSATNQVLPLLIKKISFPLIFADFCSEEEFQCYDGSCVAPENTCDGVADCTDREDESMCGRLHLSTWACLVYEFNSLVSAGVLNLPDKRVDPDCWLRSGFESPRETWFSASFWILSAADATLLSYADISIFSNLLF